MISNLADHLKWVCNAYPQIPSPVTVDRFMKREVEKTDVTKSKAMNTGILPTERENVSLGTGRSSFPRRDATEDREGGQDLSVQRPPGQQGKKNNGKQEATKDSGQSENSVNGRKRRGHGDDTAAKGVEVNNQDVAERIACSKKRKIDEGQFFLQQEYIRLCESKIGLLMHRFKIIESTSLSLDKKKLYLQTKLAPKLERINTTQAGLRKRLVFLHGDHSRSPEIGQPLGDAEFSEQVTNFDSDRISLENVAVSSQYSESHNVGGNVDKNEENIEEARRVIQDSRKDDLRDLQEPQSSAQVDVEDEDDFGSELMEGLYTPPHEKEEEQSLSSFVDNCEESFDGTFVDTQTNRNNHDDSSSDLDTVEDDNLVDEIRLSSDTAEAYGIHYDNPSISELKSKADEKSDDNDDVEEVEDFTTQLNHERELNNIEDIIEISSEEEANGSPSADALRNNDIRNNYTREEQALSIPSENKQKKSNGPDTSLIESDPGFSDDDELIHILDTHRPPIDNIPPGADPFIHEVFSKLQSVFKLSIFRPNQLEAISATLSGRDVFVLMPTGGGKSLCYQLPALINGGKTKGTTIVISPLISLMQDQIHHLLAKNIRAGMISSKGSSSERKHSLDLFRNGYYDLVYLSPEMVNASQQVQKIIKRLYDSQLFARVVVDEAHCVSSWGHDFRPDYNGMSFFKINFPSIPLMALTATANEKVRMDIVHHLQMDDPILLKQSFNRFNLFYEIKWKGSNFLEWIKDYIVTRQKNQTGIIYCHSKQSCEQTSQKLNQYGLKTSFYHAGMTSEERYHTQSQWQLNQIQIICATIAFGMGIDKADVRFVIHMFIPRTLEGYYQETGRAGRDGKDSDCILFYSYKDARTLQNMIQRDNELDREAKENHLAKLRQVVQYCENTVDCRRKQVLHYFNEEFNPLNCNKKCDNCMNSSGIKVVKKDVTNFAKDAIRLVESIEQDNVTVLHCQDVFKGSNNSKITKAGHNLNPYHGKGKQLDKTDVERIFFHLLSERCLIEYQRMRAGFASNYVKLGPAAKSVLENKKKISLQFNENQQKFTGDSCTSTQDTSDVSTDLSWFRFQSFVSAASIKNSSPLSNSDKSTEEAYEELNKIRYQVMTQLGYHNSSQVVNDSTLIDMASSLPTNKKDFLKLKDIDKSGAIFFPYFKKALTQLSRLRKKERLSPYFANGYSRNVTQKRPSPPKNPKSQTSSSSRHCRPSAERLVLQKHSMRASSFSTPTQTQARPMPL